MSLSLSELQNQFHLALKYQASGEDCCVVSDEISADDRVQIYRNNFVISLSEILSLTYPLVEAIVGEECFQGLARKHVLNVPLIEGDVSTYGSGFAETIENTEAVNTSVPYLSDIARLEWAADVSSRRPPTQQSTLQQYDLSELANVRADQQASIQLLLDPTLVVVESGFSVFSIRKAILEERYTDLETDVAEYGYVVRHDDESLSVRTLDHTTYQLLVLLQKGSRLGGIAPEILQHLPGIIELNLITGFQLEN